MKQIHMVVALLLCLISFVRTVHRQSDRDLFPMQALRASVGNPSFWNDPNPCKWSGITCVNNRVTEIQIGGFNLEGILPPELQLLDSLIVLEVQHNKLTGTIPSLSGLSQLETLLLHNNGFSSIPSDFFEGLTSLKNVILDNNPFSSWEIPQSLKDATVLQVFSANLANISGNIPDFFGDFDGLIHLHLAMNSLQGRIPQSFAKSSIQTLRLNDQMSGFKLNGSLEVLKNMTSLSQVRLHGNRFIGPLPDLSRLRRLEYLNLRENQLTGIFPVSLANLPKLRNLYFANNFFQGPTPDFRHYKFDTDIGHGFNSFCLSCPGAACDNRVNILLSIAESMGYPLVFAQSWKRNEPCDSDQIWTGILCRDNGDIRVVNFTHLGLSGTISSNFSMLTPLEKLILSENSLTGTIPNELTNLPNLVRLDVSNNHLHGKVPSFRPKVNVNTDGNPDIQKDNSSFSPPGIPNGSSPGTPPTEDRGDNSSSSSRSKNSSIRKFVGSISGAICSVLIVGLGVILYTRKRKHSKNWKHLRNATNNFSDKNILGRGGFGTVYKGELLDGTKIAVKRMKSDVVNEQGLTEFRSEIEVLSKVRHCHLVALLGYCLDGNERLLVYEYMPQGSLSRHLFNWKEEGLKPLEWTTRLSIALEVARGLEYLHGLAHQSFIHRDLKPSNILLGHDMRAKVADFGLARLVPEKGRHSIETRLVGTFGYIAPEYIVTGRVTTKVDVFSFGVILMELITGKKAVDATLPEDMVYLIPWFRRMHTDMNTFQTAIDRTIELDEETLASVSIVAELADHCCTSEPYQRPDMNHAVNVLSSLVESWRPGNPVYDDIYGINLYRYGP